MQKFNRIFNSNPAPMAVTSFAEGRFTDINDAFIDMLGYSRLEVIGKTSEELHLFVQPEKQNEVAERLCVEGRVADIELKTRCKDGSVLDGLFSGEIIESQGEKYFLTVMINQTEQKKAQRELLREFLFRNAIIENVTEGLCVCHNITKYPFVNFTVWNERMTEITGYTLEDINRLGWYQTVYPESELQAKAIERMEEMRRGDNLCAEEWEIVRADGVKRLLSISSSIIESEDGIVHVLALMQDITERKWIEKELKQSESLRRAVFDSVDDFIFVKDLNKSYKLINHFFKNNFQIDSTVFIGKMDAQIHIFKDKEYTMAIIRDTDDKVLQGETVKYMIEHRIGEYLVTFDVTKTPLRDESGNIIGICGLSRNVSERVKMEKEQERLVLELQKSLSKVKKLSGLLPICASCKKIRDDKGYWNQVEVYVGMHADVQFSHGICPECAERLYPELFEDAMD